MGQSHLLHSTEDVFEARTKRWHSFLIAHQAYVHPSRFCVFTGLFLLTGDLSFILLFMQWVVAAKMTLDLACILLFVVFPWLMFAPCKCGKQPLLTVQVKREIHNFSKVKLIQVATFAAFAVLLLHLVRGYITPELSSLIPAHIVRLASVIFVLSGFGFLGASLLVTGLTGNVSWCYNGRLLSEREQQRIRELSLKCGKSISELDELIGYQLKLGEFEKADETSRLLLKVAECPCLASNPRGT